MTYLDLARHLTTVSFALCALTVVLVAVGLIAADRRFINAARRSQMAIAFTIAGSAAGLVAGFFNGAYGVQYIYSYSESKLSPFFKFAGLWAGLDGSILFWALLLAIVGAVVAFGFHRERHHPVGRRLEPYVYIVFSCILAFFLGVMTFEASPFRPISPELKMMLGRAGLLGPGDIPADGSGLNPLLVNYWMMIHPPNIYIAFVTYTVPFAFGIASLLAGEHGTYWITKTRRWTLIAWLFNTNGCVLGGLWAYEVLGWGGYWAWDPVENASFLPWLTGTAFLHSVMIQERRDMLRGWNFFLVSLTFFMSIFGTYLTRSGIVSSVHAFASGAVGDWFLGFLIAVAAVSLFLLAFRSGQLRSPHRIDSIASREAVFLLNNLILIAIAAAILVLTLYPKLSAEFLGNPMSVGVPVYNLVCTPLFIILLLLTALGPGMGWIRTSPKTMLRNLALPVALSLPLAAGTQWLSYVVIRGGAHDEPVSVLDQIYPTAIVIFLGWLIIVSLAWEVFRAVRSLAPTHGWPGGLVRLITLNNRRYGGYIVHVGLAVLAIGIVVSSMFRITREVRIEAGGTARVEPYEIKVHGVEEGDEPNAYHSLRLLVDVHRDGRKVAALRPEKRLYPKTGYRHEPQVTTEVSIERSLAEDFYVYFDRPAETSGYILTIFRNPLVNFVWLGWITMLAGGIFAALPLRRRRVGLAE